MEYVVQQGFNALSIGGEYALLALGLAIVFSVMGLVNFAHGEFITVSGYTMYALFIFATPTSAWSLLPIGILASITAAVVFERTAFRPIRNAPATTGLLTAFGLSITRGPRALYGIPVSTNIVWLMFISAGAVIAARLFRDSKSGVQLRASGEDIDAAEAMGVNIRWLRLVAWTLSGAIIAVGGVMYAYLIGSISPKSFYFEATFLTLAMLILGGTRSVSGAVIGAIVVTVGFEIMRYFESAPEILGLQLPQIFGLTGFFLGGTIVLFMALRPDGLIGNDELDEIVERYLGRRRSRIESGAGRN